MNISDNIKSVRKSLGLTQAEFAARLGIKPNTVTTYETGIRVPSDAVIISICRQFNVSEHWIRTGEGEMFLQLDKDSELEQILAEIAGSEDETIKKIIRAYWKLDEKEKTAIRKLIDNLANDGN